MDDTNANTTDRTARRTDDTDVADTDEVGTSGDDTDEPENSVTPDGVVGEVDYGKLLDRFGADALTDDQVKRFPQPLHPLLRRGIYYAGRDVDRLLGAIESDERLSIVTGVGPSGPMHVGHAVTFYFAKWLQAETGATVYVPLSDDEKYLSRDQSLAETREYTRENLRDLVAVGFDPERTRFVIDTADADVVYPLATALAERITPAARDAVYGEPANVGMGFYPAVQATHLVLPQFVEGPHATTVPIAVDQDPHVRLARDVAAKERFPVEKPGALLSKFLPGLEGPGKMSSSDDTPTIHLTDDRETVHEKLGQAYSGGRTDREAHREHGGEPEVDVAYQLLRVFFEPDDDAIERLAREYRAGELLSGELKAHAADRIADFLDAHQARRPSDADLDDVLAPYRLTATERERALTAAGLGSGVTTVDPGKG
ncbi:tryptophan--tRNA ligase [Halococcus saccharolyticus]|uniref:Tryptophan--tRNA ligase n=1 Tax=Halococcus saccharolyticus DSM 5350 TaxID=1227455 RepID=M0M9H3_9EURY|nr:tryptophan--tRNA ligase [Halococcus saccharolyticus]EMA42442.1 tryptophanyl-tRNA synthetase [Halococcus saccharolyticus DSM 5350]